jgi:hypothetical protein
MSRNAKEPPGYASQHRRAWRWLRRRSCSCGLTWPCPDYTGWAPGTPIPDGMPRIPADRPEWDGPTRNVPVAPLLIRGQDIGSRQAGTW